MFFSPQSFLPIGEHTGIRGLWLALLLVAMPALAFIMGEDNREEIVEPDKQPPAIRQTGIISIPGEEFVSGFVTGANCDVVISAGHAAFYNETITWKGWRRGQRRGIGTLTFQINPRRSAAQIPMSLIASGYANSSNIGNDENDWAIFQLQTPALRRCRVVSVWPANRRCTTAALLPAFHFDRPYVLLVDRHCSIRDQRDQGLLIHDCDTKDGSSGAPLFCMQDQHAMLAGINISGISNRQYYDPGVYGLGGAQFNYKMHKNYAVAVHGAFQHALQSALTASARRAME